MTLVDDYLRAVALLLPKAQRDDIVAELRDTLLTRIEEREAELGRALTEDETEGVLREVGHPLVVAARYRGGPQHIAGPALYPYWAFAVKVSVTIQVVVAAIAFFARSVGGGDVALAFSAALSAAFTGSATLIGIATAVAWMVERRNIKIGYLDRWRVKDLRGLEVFAWNFDAWSARVAGVRRARPGAVAGRGLGAMMFGTFLVLWWTGALPIPLAVNDSEFRAAGIDTGRLAINWTSFRDALFWPVLIYGLAIVGQGAVLLARPGATVLHGVLDIIVGAAELAFATWVWTASSLARSVRVDSVAAFATRASGVFHPGALTDLSGLLMIGVAVAAIFATGRIARGCWDVLTGRTSITRAPLVAQAPRA